MQGETSPTVESEVVAGRGPGTTMQFQPRPVPMARGLGALRHRDFRVFWLGQIVSLIGTWMQLVAQAWLVLELTGSPLVLGLVNALQFLPILTLSMLGGVLADRLPRRRILLATQLTAMLLALILAALTASGTVQIGHVMALALLIGVVSAVDMPTRQAFVVEMVGVQDLRNAIALNSAAFNAARLIGPALAGLAIGWVGLAGAFFLNALSFLGVIGGLLAVRAGRRPVGRGARPGSLLDDLKEGLEYVAGSPRTLSIVVMVAAVGIFGMNMGVLIPVLARDVLQVGAQGFGILTSALGAGSLVAAIILAYLGQAPKRRRLLAAAIALGLLQVVLANVDGYGPSLLLLACIGFSMIFFTTLANTALQTSTPDALRGRVMSLYTTVFVGTTPLGSLFAGWLAEGWGVDTAFLLGGSAAALLVVAGYHVGTLRRNGR